MVSYFEWLQNLRQAVKWEEEEINKATEHTMVKAFQDVWNMAEKHQTSLRMGAFIPGPGTHRGRQLNFAASPSRHRRNEPGRCLGFARFIPPQAKRTAENAWRPRNSIAAAQMGQGSTQVSRHRNTQSKRSRNTEPQINWCVRGKSPSKVANWESSAESIYLVAGRSSNALRSQCRSYGSLFHCGRWCKS